VIDFVALQTALAGQYFLERELRRGGMGVVYLAREVRLDRPVAVKVLPPALARHEHLRTRFLREARTAAMLAHPHIVPIHRVDEVGPFVYLAMGYVARGRTAPSAFVDRPTEHAIGLAADELLAALPDPARRQLGDVPEILRGLEREAEEMRRRADALGRRLSELDAPGPSGAADRRAAIRDELHAARDQALGRRDAAVTALEAVRLDLLRVHADVAPSALTDLVERARRLGRVVDAGPWDRTSTRHADSRSYTPVRGENG
jgi:hypothetical protein